MSIIILILSQVLFSFFRTLNTRYVSRDKILMSLVTGTIIRVLWLITTYIGISAIFEGDYAVASVYVVSGVMGDYFSFLIKL